MKQKEAIAAFLAGKPILIVEYRGHQIEKIGWRDKVSGQQVEKQTQSHSVEAGNMQMRISEWVQDGVNPETLKPKFTKGTPCVFVIKSMKLDKGILRGEGDLEPYELDGTK